MIAFERRPRRKRLTPIVPLIDVMFLLLIFFMLTSQFGQTESMDLALPSVQSIQKNLITDDEAMRMVIASDGTVQVDGENFEPDVLEKMLAAALRQNPERKVVLMPMELVSVQQLVAVMDSVTHAGGHNVQVVKWQAPPPAEEIKEEPKKQGKKRGHSS